MDETIEARWSAVNIPAEGKSGGWTLAKGSDIKQIARASNNTLYAHVQGLSYSLYKSVDDGYTWTETGKVKDNMVALIAVPGSPDLLYYATESAVYRSTDGAASFVPVGISPGGAGSQNIQITALAVSGGPGNSILLVGTKDTDPAQYGGVYVFKESEPFTGWTDTGIGAYDVYAVAFSPGFMADCQVLAVVNDEAGTLVRTMSVDGWGKMVGDAAIPVATLESADIALPEDFDSDINTGRNVFFVAVNTGSDDGDVFRVRGFSFPADSLALDLNIGSRDDLSGIDITSLEAAGPAVSARLLAGAAGSRYILEHRWRPKLVKKR